MTGVLLRMAQLTAMLGIHKSTVYRMMEKGEFPRPIRLGPNSVAWRTAEVEEWLASRPRD